MRCAPQSMDFPNDSLVMSALQRSENNVDRAKKYLLQTFMCTLTHQPTELDSDEDEDDTRATARRDSLTKTPVVDALRRGISRHRR